MASWHAAACQTVLGELYAKQCSGHVQNLPDVRRGDRPNETDRCVRDTADLSSQTSDRPVEAGRVLEGLGNALGRCFCLTCIDTLPNLVVLFYLLQVPLVLDSRGEVLCTSMSEARSQLKAAENGNHHSIAVIQVRFAGCLEVIS